MRRRLLTYLTAACINLAIVSGTHLPSSVARPAVVQVRARDRSASGFDRGEIIGGSAIIVADKACEPDWFCAN